MRSLLIPRVLKNFYKLHKALTELQKYLRIPHLDFYLFTLVVKTM